ncbi:SAM-dependent methyltransferase [Amycolatopsis magusensis]|uniref:SAM-dependent methyltransferase n=1 Tax=Amycolatopsis magusensis TaxID=882444 RepID=UPI00379B2B6D
MSYDTAVLERPDATRIDSALKLDPDAGTFSFALDRHWIDEQQIGYPDLREVVQRSVTFGISVVRASCDAGYTQFLDLGCGYPDRTAVHRITHDRGVDARVTAVDNSRWVTLHWERALEGSTSTRFLSTDLTDAAAVMQQIASLAALDLTRPVCLTLVDVLHHLEPHVARQVLAQYYELLPVGSRLALTQRTDDNASAEQAARIAGLAEAYHDIGAPTWIRTRTEFLDLLGPWSLCLPGVVSLRQWPLASYSPTLPDGLGALSWGAVAGKRSS